MHDKTQVFPLTSDDNIHTRLTHSTEVMSLSYTFGLKCAASELIQKRTEKTELELLRIIPIILQSVCFIHDIGNPPFGHFAETIVADYFDKMESNENPLINDRASVAFKGLTEHQRNDFLHFDGNAQGLRVITKLQYLDDVFGLNLTYAILGSYLKYPNYYDSLIDKKGKKELKRENISRGKHGVFFSELPYFEKIISACGLFGNEHGPIRHPLCYLMEASDSIAYRVMDMEDGFSKGFISIDYIKSKFADNPSKVAETVVFNCNQEGISDAAKMVFIRIALIDYLVTLAYNNFENNLDAIEQGTYNKELIDDDPHGIEKVLSDICVEKIFSSREINHLETTGHSVISGLLNHYINQLFHKNDDFANRAISLISCSVINVALEEDMPNYLRSKYGQIDRAKLTFQQGEIYNRLGNNIDSYFEAMGDWDNYQQIKYNPVKALRNQIYSDFEVLKVSIDFFDLTDYYKFRVIVDFISGMTDQFALSHFQKISGQRIG